MKHLLVLVLLLMSLCTTLNSALILEMEYYLDLDTESEQCFPLSFSEAELAEGSGTLDLSDLSPGFHRFSTRVKDSDGLWSFFNHRMVYKMEQSSPDLTALHYCLDNDESFATLPLQVLDAGRTWILNGELSFPPETEPGLHVLKLWVEDTEGSSSLRNNKIFLYNPPQTTQNIVSFSWYFSGPGADPTQEYHFFPANPLPDLTTEILAALPDLSPGESYQLHLYAKQSSGTASLHTAHSFIYDFRVEGISIVLDGNELLISWDAIPNALHYLVERKPSPEAEGEWTQTPNPWLEITPVADREFFRVKAVK
ncbi:MAG: hypothetical protein V3576_00155 [Candidatus Cloacimonadota bacterium]